MPQIINPFTYLGEYLQTGLSLGLLLLAGSLFLIPAQTVHQLAAKALSADY